MSAVARLLLAHGVSVSGSDAQESRGLAALRERGAAVSIGQSAENIADAQTVVVSTAIRDTNPELAAAREQGLRVLHRSEALAVSMHGSRVVAVAGTHGKTTTSSMAAVALQESGRDPSWAIGAHVADLGTNAHLGRGEWFVAEADESDGSFLSYGPTIAVVTNIEPDHLDHYGSEEAFFRAFDDFAATLRPGGTLVACQDDAGSRRLAEAVRRRGGSVLTYGTDASAQIRISDIRTEGIGATATVSVGEGADLRTHRMRLEVPGEHNVLNAAAAFAVTQIAGVPAEDALRGLAKFHGSDRRFDLKGEARGIRVIDDYAHHPTEVRAALAAARRVAGEHRVLVLFQPHLFSRTRAFAPEFAEALELADRSWVLPIFAAREDPVDGVSSELISEAAGESVVSAFDPQEAVEQIAAAAQTGDLVLTVGAGDVTAFGARLLAALEDAEGIGAGGGAGDAGAAGVSA
ncbi:UDP-N-acetylmuramate--L-alanine ligase [Kocuria palustris]|uniref:UDP-N-acetylmuramate--L-alanine ligase n=1 Tax=Kocuria palustris TaxID=71999 RepID=UPI0037BF9704